MTEAKIIALLLKACSEWHPHEETPHDGYFVQRSRRTLDSVLNQLLAPLAREQRLARSIPGLTRQFWKQHRTSDNFMIDVFPTFARAHAKLHGQKKVNLAYSGHALDQNFWNDFYLHREELVHKRRRHFAGSSHIQCYYMWRQAVIEGTPEVQIENLPELRMGQVASGEATFFGIGKEYKGERLIDWAQKRNMPLDVCK